MSGLVPYKDFTDSKGPLLWLLYGIGYLLSPRSFIGMFWIEVGVYWITFLLIFKSAFLILHSESKALMIVFLIAIFFFLPGAHMEIRAEDFNQCLNAVLLYILVIIFLRKKTGLIYFFGIGIILGMSLLIKYNFTVCQIVPVVILLIPLQRSQGIYRLFKFIGLILCGFSVVVLPFVLFLLFQGAFENFISEYFINTLITVNIVRDLAPLPWNTKWFILLFIIITLLALWMPKRIFKSQWLKFSIFTWFVISLIIVLFGAQEYYFNILGIFAFPGLCSLAAMMARVDYAKSILIGALSIFCIAYFSTFLQKGEFYNVEAALSLNKTYDQIDILVNSYSKETNEIPSITFVNLHDRGEHVNNGMLPGTFYYAHQTGSSDEMHNKNLDDVFIKRPDFVVVSSDMKDYRCRLEKEGYKLMLIYPTGAINERCLYQKKLSNNK